MNGINNPVIHPQQPQLQTNVHLITSEIYTMFMSCFGAVLISQSHKLLSEEQPIFWILWTGNDFMKTDLLAQLTGTFQHLHQGALVFNLIGFLIFSLSQMDYGSWNGSSTPSWLLWVSPKWQMLKAHFQICVCFSPSHMHIHTYTSNSNTVTLTEMLIYTH